MLDGIFQNNRTEEFMYKMLDIIEFLKSWVGDILKKISKMDIESNKDLCSCAEVFMYKRYTVG